MVKIATEVGIDLGTSNLLVYRRNKGIILMEPTVVAVSRDTKKVYGIGTAAREMLGRTPGNIIAVRPLREGVIADYTVTVRMLEQIRKRVVGKHQLWIKPTALISVPSGITNVERRAVHKAARSAGFGRVSTIEEPMAAAIGVGLPIADPGGNLIVDIGGGTTDAAVISLGGTVLSTSIRVGGNKMDDAISKYIRTTFNLAIGDQTAEEVKIQIGSAFPQENEETMEIRGRDLIGGLPRTISITAQQVREALSEPVRQIAEKILTLLEDTPPELAADIIERGITLTGGGSLLRGFDTMLAKVTEVEVRVAENAMHAVAVGTGRALENFHAFEDAGMVSDL